MNKLLITIIFAALFFADSAAFSRSFLPIDAGIADNGCGGITFPKAEQLSLAPDKNKDILSSIQDLSALGRPEVKEAFYRYLTSGKEYAKKGLLRAEKYKPVLNEVHALYPDIPQEVLYLPLLESAFDPTAVSRMKAVGMWQIIAPTALQLGLRIDSMLDERRDVKKSTDAALRHLLTLKNYFPTWDLALAAYNCGSGRITRGMYKYKTNDFWTLSARKALRKETADYIPSFAALAIIGTHPELFPVIDLTAVTEPEEYEKYTLTSPVLINTISRLTGVPCEEIYEINPELTGKLTPVTVKNYQITLPAGAGEKLAANEEFLYSLKISSISSYRIRKGDTIAKISKKFGTNPELIALINGINIMKALRAGNTLLIPLS